MNEELLIRIAEALESINGSLSDIALSLENLDRNFDSCIIVTEKGNFLKIAGSVTNC